MDVSSAGECTMRSSYWACPATRCAHGQSTRTLVAPGSMIMPMSAPSATCRDSVAMYTSCCPYMTKECEHVCPGASADNQSSDRGHSQPALVALGTFLPSVSASVNDTSNLKCTCRPRRWRSPPPEPASTQRSFTVLSRMAQQPVAARGRPVQASITSRVCLGQS